MVLATAQDLPSELLRPIAIWLGRSKSSFLQPLDKRGLAASSLTCRDWAKVIRPFIFRDLTLRSPEDINDLIVILSWIFFRSLGLIHALIHTLDPLHFWGCRSLITLRILQFRNAPIGSLLGHVYTLYQRKSPAL